MKLNGKRHWFSGFARRYVRRKLRVNFADVRMNGLEELQQMSASQPLLLACNHVAWWDPLLLVHLESHLHCDGYCLMDKTNLEQLPFFAWVGALPLDRTSRRNAYRDLMNSLSLLDRPGRVLAIFPQGKHQPHHLPLGFRPGVATLAIRAQVPIVPLAIRYDYGESPRPMVHLSAGTPLSPPSQPAPEFIGSLERQVRNELDRIDRSLSGEEAPFPSILGRASRAASSGRLPLGARALRLLTPGASS